MVVTTPWGGCSCAGHFRCFRWWTGDCLFLARFDHQSDRMSTTLVLLLASAAAGRGQRRSRGSLLLEVGIDVNFARLLGTWKWALSMTNSGVVHFYSGPPLLTTEHCSFFCFNLLATRCQPTKTDKHIGPLLICRPFCLVHTFSVSSV